MNLQVLCVEYGEMEDICHKADSRDVLLNKCIDHHIKVLNAAYEQRVSRTDATVISVIELYSITITMYFFPSLSRSLSPVLFLAATKVLRDVTEASIMG